MGGKSIFILLFLAVVLFAGSLYLLGLSCFVYQVMVYGAYGLLSLSSG
jgi:hypothetical protein